MKNKLYFNANNTKEEQRAFEAIVKEQETVGYYALPNQDVSPILEYCNTISQDVTTIAVIGIGGSSLGAKAVYEFMKPVKELSRKLYFFESTDPINITDLLSKFDVKTTHFLVISKSGSTVETFSIYKYIYSLQSDPSAYTFITDPGSPLEKYAQSIKASVLHLPDNVGGRFSVLSSVGLVPLALCGIDIISLLAGAKKIKSSFFDNGYTQDMLLNKAVYYAKNHAQYNINCIFAYSETLKYFCQWYVQLWGESLGKHQRHSAFHVGLTPIGLIGPKDQHSFLQLIMEGTRDKSVTFIKIEDFHEDIVIPDITLPHLEMLDTLNNLPFSKLINMQCDSVVEALLDQESIPLDTITLQSVTEDNIGSLIFYYELLTSLVGELIDVNTYDQPGVEAGKIILKKKLG
ncbi:MAG TPA: glucose-6-phosphate isomerase [Sulfurovum sp.]|jgi:glucose-6-phosphate isomerase|nr:MAG: glucose-6-phosphate isomerase [Sulfurovum sp. 35-42-20]OYZ25669.1 MAG: glucose-6-phosphate isomerase [Sulfurovum sp. 16-42-52]OYZ50212.1 MAG: glucose-6-phosphate isomerase [Sulfurovum sp. 24-42-9]OZA45786.1 MAG: glucose-6-phosphate isomerase [Sulfurovum sp. 17-42-90]OZA60258.1 MAG: glucose-6-phosphate isomerase [Sulfurovum sp. 39-42-12]HQR73287.1 glucose-6-phosphate isomerase [Sulfurovum sp.]